MNGRLSTPVAEMLSVSVPDPPLPSPGPAPSSAHAVVPTSRAVAATTAPISLGKRDIRETSEGR